MGVNGLWRLIEPSGKPVPVETLENQVLAVDVSIWLHQVTKGYQDASGNALPNAHLLGLFHRLCKLLFYKIRPVFVFDGGIPHLKKQTVIARRQQKTKAEQVAERMREKLLKNLIKHNAVKNALGKQTWPSEVGMPRVRTEDDMFQLPPSTQAEEESDSSESADEPSPVKYNDLHTIDVNSAHFRSLPADMRHDILVELKETRKQSSWGRLHEIPKESNDFSSYQMKRLLKRRSVQVGLEEAEKEMGGKSLSLGELEELMADNGIVVDSEIGKRIASDSTTRFIFINGAKVESTTSSCPKNEQTSSQVSTSQDTATENSKTSTSDASKVEELFEYEDYDIDDEIDYSEWNMKFSDEEELNEDIPKNLNLAKNFMFENSGLTQSQILAIIKTQNSSKKDGKKQLSLDMPSTSKMSSNEYTSCSATLSENVNLTTVEDSPSISDGDHKGDLIYDKEISHLTSVISNKASYKDNSLSYEIFKPKDANIDKTKSEVVKSSVAPITSEVLNVSTVTSTKKNTDDSLPQNESDSESDAGFIEVEDESLSAIDWNTPEKKTISSENLDKLEISNESVKPKIIANSNKTSSLQVVIQPTKLDMKDDIFADIFTNNSGNAQTNSSISKNTDLSLNSVNMDNEESGNLEDMNDVSENLISVNNCIGISVQTDITKNVERDVNGKNNALLPEASQTMSKSISSDSDVKNSGKLDGMKSKSIINFSGVVQSDNVTPESNVEENENNISKQKNKENTINVIGIESNVSQHDTTSQNIIDVVKQKENVVVNEIPKAVLDAAAAERLQKLQTSLESEHYRLMVEKGRQERLAASITDQMYSEAQALLQLFGVPYIVAPMEAEAQCAYLDAVSLTDGTITDDSDIWLFGGKQVYKNFFDQKKHVLKFRASDIQHYFKLSRQEMILLALLVGSDYTVGLQGVGPVTALEILATFHPQTSEEQEANTEMLVECLQNFRTWWASGKASGPVKVPLRNKVKDLKIHAGFPSSAVIEAYLHPQIDDSRETFSWGNPDLITLRKYALEKFGWSQNKTDSILLPVMKKLNERTSQQTLDSFVRSKPKLPLPEGRVSKRVQSAINHMGAEDGSNSDNEIPAAKIQKLNRGTFQRVRNRGRGRGRAEINCEISEMSREPPGAISRQINHRGRGRGRGRDVTELERSGLNYEPEENAPKKEFILQREKDKLNSLKNKLKAIEIYRKSKRGLDHTKREKKVRKTIAAPNLSDSSDSN